MSDFIKSKLFPSLIRICSWIKMPLIGFIIGIILYAFFVWVNLDMKMFFLDMATARENKFWGIAGVVAIKLIKILLITIICLVIPSIKHGIVAGRILILMISIYWGLIFLFFINTSAYLTIVYLSMQVLSVIWCLSIGTLKIEFIEKTKLAIMPFTLLAAVSICQLFF